MGQQHQLIFLYYFLFFWGGGICWRRTTRTLFPFCAFPLLANVNKLGCLCLFTFALAVLFRVGQEQLEQLLFFGHLPRMRITNKHISNLPQLLQLSCHIPIVIILLLFQKYGFHEMFLCLYIISSVGSRV